MTKTTPELAAIIAALPTSVITLNLDECPGFNAEQKDTIMGALPLGVESITLDGQVINRDKYYVNKILADVTLLTAKHGMA
jgi:hypothetical protein